MRGPLCPGALLTLTCTTVGVPSLTTLRWTGGNGDIVELPNLLYEYQMAHTFPMNISLANNLAFISYRIDSADLDASQSLVDFVAVLVIDPLRVLNEFGIQELQCGGLPDRDSFNLIIDMEGKSVCV